MGCLMSALTETPADAMLILSKDLQLPQRATTSKPLVTCWRADLSDVVTRRAFRSPLPTTMLQKGTRSK